MTRPLTISQHADFIPAFPRNSHFIFYFGALLIIQSTTTSPTPELIGSNFIFIKVDNTSVYKFTNGERASVNSLIASLTIKRIPEPDIIKAIFEQTGKTISDIYLYSLKAQIEKESYGWYKAMRQSQYTYVHEFKKGLTRSYGYSENTMRS